jgi:ABC-type transporter Mla subunit MlaD
MRRVAAVIGLVGVAGLLVFGLAAGGEGGTYEVRGIFDNGNFLVTGEQVRVAGVTVGSIDSVDVTMPGDWANRSCFADPKSKRCFDPGKAVVVMKITDSAFQDFRRDASCLIRPQSLLGEKYVDCSPTQPRSPGTPPPPPLPVIPSGQPGAGQRFLPVQNNGQEVDLDLINNILREPYADRFRLILNSLGAGLAARGKTLSEIIGRADPALRETDRVLAILARQNHQLAQLARHSDTILQPLARQRQHLAGFINHANTAAEATAERSADLEAGFQKFPEALRQLRLEMVQLRRFSDQGAPLFAEFGAGAPAIARSTRALGPFAHAATPALVTLGKASEQAKRPIVESEPLLRRVRRLGQEAAPGSTALTRLLRSLRTTGFWQQFTKFLYFSTGSVNGFDQYGHFLRAVLQYTGCTNLFPVTASTCDAHWGANAAPKAPTLQQVQEQVRQAVSQAGVSPAASQAQDQAGQAGGTGVPLDATGAPAGGDASPVQGGSPSQSGGVSVGAARDLLHTMLGTPGGAEQGGRR